MNKKFNLNDYNFKDANNGQFVRLQHYNKLQH